MLREIGRLGSQLEEELSSLSCRDGGVELDGSASLGPEAPGGQDLAGLPVPSPSPVLPVRLGEHRNLNHIQLAGLPVFPYPSCLTKRA